jgi:hypothetical protein
LGTIILEFDVEKDSNKSIIGLAVEILTAGAENAHAPFGEPETGEEFKRLFVASKYIVKILGFKGLRQCAGEYPKSKMTATLLLLGASLGYSRVSIAERSNSILYNE